MKISEIFYSLQGEGIKTGKAAIFIRFYGCNLNCSFCDEPLHRSTYKEMGQEEILSGIEQYPSQFVILTGGEPSLHNLNDFIQKLQKLHYYVAIETNGYSPVNIRKADWITYSPKDWSALNSFDGVDEIKLVVNSRDNPEQINLIQTGSHKPVLLQPQAEQGVLDWKNISFCIQLVKNNSKLRLSLQIHKLLNIP
jgi:organic radical activating enzyme